MKFLVPINLDQNELLNARIQNLGSDPGSGVEGQIYYNTTSDKLRVYAGGSWQDVSTSYVHPTYAGDDINVDTGIMTGATVVSRVDFNVTTDTLGHVTDANGAVTTRTLTLADLGHGSYTPLSLSLNEDQSGSGLGVVDSISLDITTDALGNVTGLTGSATGKVITDLNIAAAAIDDSHTGTSFAWSADRILNEISSSVAGQLVYKGGYDASLNSPDLETPAGGTVLQGYTYTVTVGGVFFTANVEPGDLLIAEVDDPAAEADWTIVNKNIPTVSDELIQIFGGSAINLTGDTSFTLNGSAANITINHSDTSSVANNTNTGGTVIQSLTFDGFGHVQTHGEVNLDTRYVNVTGDTMTGNLKLNDNVELQFGTGNDSNIVFDSVSGNTEWNVNNGNLDFIHQGTSFMLWNHTTDAITTPYSLSAGAISGTTVSGTLSGNGAGITNLNASNLTTGSIADARVPSTAVTQHVTQAYINTLNVDADTLDGVDSSAFLRANVNTIKSAGFLTLNDDIELRFGISGGESSLYSDAVNTILNIQSGDYIIKYQGVNRWGIDGVTGNITHHTGNLQMNSGDITVISGDVNITSGQFNGSGAGLTGVDADQLQGQNGAYYLNYNNTTNKPRITVLIGDGTTNPIRVPHGLNSTAISATFYEGNTQVMADVVIFDANNIDVYTTTTLTTDQLTAVIKA